MKNGKAGSGANHALKKRKTHPLLMFAAIRTAAAAMPIRRLCHTPIRAGSRKRRSDPASCRTIRIDCGRCKKYEFWMNAPAFHHFDRLKMLNIIDGGVSRRVACFRPSNVSNYSFSGCAACGAG
ncbi:hypothetical protein [Pusillimonas sp.]|uniref:hypothetical protein n=1 Tax=Pusillimonas sp. TaxID=3040095 RepID=UPI0029AE7CE8|nr:hypothetical protein [Pusillimonas sp.]MDX3893235.1 hypothetical protein [Pusillimonas sp.]